MNKLTRREREILTLYVELGSLALVAERLNLALSTVKNLLGDTRVRYEVRSIGQLTYLLGAGELDES